MKNDGSVWVEQAALISDWVGKTLESDWLLGIMLISD